MKRFFLISLFIFSTSLLGYEEFNSTVLVEISRGERTFICSGFFVTPKKILTSAHCLDGLVSQVRIFTHNKYNNQNEFLKIQDFHIHPEYDPLISNFHADIAVIELKYPYVKLIKTPEINCQKNLWGSFVRLGFGKRLEENQRTSLLLKLKRNLPESSYLEFFETDSQSGDSGGPIYLVNDKKISLLAIHSTLSFGPLGRYSFNPKICSFKKWIDEI
jgi:hypothetical protein